MLAWRLPGRHSSMDQHEPPQNRFDCMLAAPPSINSMVQFGHAIGMRVQPSCRNVISGQVPTAGKEGGGRSQQG